MFSKKKDTCERVQSNYQNFRILKSEFLEPPLNAAGYVTEHDGADVLEHLFSK